MVVPKSSKYDNSQILPFAFDDETGKLKIDTTEIRTIITEVVNSQLTYIGKSLDTSTDTSENVWQIARHLKQGGTTTISYANGGEYDQSWDNRVVAFPTIELNNPASLQFDGVNEYINFGNNYTFGPASSFSWSVWFKANNFSAQRALIAKISQDSNVYGYSFQHTSSGKLFAQFRASGNLRAHTFNTTLTSGVWYNVIFTYNGGSNMNGITAYINGQPEPNPPSGTNGDWSSVTDPLLIASRGGAFNFSGNMNQVSVWNKELSSSEVLELYNSGNPSNLTQHSANSNLLSWWRLNNSESFPTEVDTIGSINGTLINMEVLDYKDSDVP